MRIRVVVGTHALFQEGVNFAHLALVIVDEQHRFGVQQRLRLQEKGQKDGRVPHQLIMTATPIPRTLAMTAYADLDISVIDELPPGRTPVKTVVIPEQRRDEVVLRIVQACREGRQAYWVCPLIEESEELRSQAAEETAAALAEALPEVRGRARAWAYAFGKERRGHAGVQSRQNPTAGGYDGDRGWRRRAERDADGDRKRRAYGDWRNYTNCAAVSDAGRKQALACCYIVLLYRNSPASG